MHIAYLLTPPGIPLGGPSGSSRHVASLVEAFVRQGHRVSLFASMRLEADPLASLEGAGLQVVVIPPSRAPFSCLGRPARERWQSLRLAKAALERLEADRPDLLYERYALFSEAGGWLRERLGAPWVIEVNAPLRLERAWFEGLRADRASRRAERRALRRADRLLAVSTPLARYLEQEAGCDPARVTVLPNGVDRSLFRPMPKPAGLAAGLGLSSGPVVGFVGSLKRWHGLDRWLEVLERVRRSIPEARGLVVGEGPLAGEMRARTARYGLEGVVRFAGQVPYSEVPAYLALMDLLLAPYPRLEPFYFSPMKVVEALAAGVPVVTTAQGDLADLVGGAGVAVDPDDLGALVGGVIAVLEDRALRRRWSEAGPGRVADRDWTAVAARIARICASPEEAAG